MSLGYAIHDLSFYFVTSREDAGSAAQTAISAFLLSSVIWQRCVSCHYLSCVYCVDWEIEICHTPAIDSKRAFAFSSCFSICSSSGSWLFLLWMANESRADRRPVDWARFGLSSEQNSASSEVHFANKPSVLDETSYGGQEVRDNELYTEEQVCFHIGFVYFGCCGIIA